MMFHWQLSQKPSNRLTCTASLLLAALAHADVAVGSTLAGHAQEYVLDSGVHKVQLPAREPTADDEKLLDDEPRDEGDTARAVRGEPVFREVVSAPGAPWIRLRLSDYRLGRGSYVTFMSLHDGGFQRHDARTLAEWKGYTAFFNGDSVEVSLYAAAGDEDVFIRMEDLVVGEWHADLPDEAEGGVATPCGDDNRVLSSDDRVGRVSWCCDTAGAFVPSCTAWLVSNGALLTAGHCVDRDPDGNGPMLTDGVADGVFLTGVVEFNVPQSQDDGTPVLADPDDQYPIDNNNVAFNFDGAGQGLGKDWAVFKCGRNSNTFKRPSEVQGTFFRMTSNNPTPLVSNIRITGFGVDDTPDSRNQVQQTNVGQYQAELSAGNDIWHSYYTDTEPANSGSPIIWNDENVTVGIHTNGGCAPPAFGNTGTSFEHDPLANAVQQFAGGSAIYVDEDSWSDAQTGHAFNPWHDFHNAVPLVPSGGVLSIVKGNYTAAEGNDITIGADGRSMTIVAPVGTVRIGD